MPYFFICPLYALLFMALMLVSLVLLFIRSWRQYSSYVFFGALGTLPGFIFGNVVFLLVAWGMLAIHQKPMSQVTSDIAQGIATFNLIIFFVSGLAIANLGGCVAGFLGGIWIRSMFRKKIQANPASASNRGLASSPCAGGSQPAVPDQYHSAGRSVL